MSPSTPVKVAAMTAVTALALSGCADDGAAQDTAPPEVSAVPTTATDTTVETTTQTGGPADDLPYGPVGSEVTIVGEPATICIHGDGWGTNIWAGNQNTSCEFVIATHEALIEGLNATEDNIRDHLRDQVEVYSPVTGQEYTLTCAPRNEKLVTCSGADEAAVHFY